MIKLAMKILSVHLVLLILLSNAGFASELPNYYPKAFVKTGSIDELNIASQRIIIGDEVFRMDGSLLVHNLNNQRVSTASVLALGMRVGTTTINNGKVFELWILPADYDPDAEDK